MSDQAQSLRDKISRLKENHTSGSFAANPPPTFRRARIVAVTSGKGGAGKTNFSVNFAIELAKRGKRVLLIDADFGFANVGIILGISPRYDLTSVINGVKNIDDIIMSGPHGVKFISGGSGLVDLVTLGPDILESILPKLISFDKMADYIIFDTGAGVTDNIMRIIKASDEVILVTTPEPTAILDAYALLKMSTRDSFSFSISIVINRAENYVEANKISSNFKNMIKKHLGVDVHTLGYVFDDLNVVRAVKCQRPFIVKFPDTVAADNITTIADTFLQNRATAKKSGGFGNLLDFILKR